MPANPNKPPAPAWAGYAFAVATTAAVFVFRFEVDHLIGNRISLPLCGFAAVFACVWRVGLGPALLAAVLTTAWYVSEIQGLGLAAPGTLAEAGPDAWIHYGLYMLVAGVVCIYGRQLRVAKDEAARGEDWQRHLVETTGEGIWMVDPEGVIGYANPRIAEILGCTVAQIEGRKVEAFLFPEDFSAERIRFTNRREGVREQFDRRLRRADGSEVWTLACSSPYSYGNKDAGVLTMMTDITERKQAEHALRRSERKFRELFENIREGVYQTSPDGRILAANPELLRMIGFSSPEELNVPGVVRETFVDTDLHQSLRDRLERAGSYANVEFQLRTRDHRIITVRENARVVRDENGNVLYYEGTLTDITDMIRFEKQLREAQKMEALGRLAGGIARDFRGIGAGIVTGLQRALEVLPADSPARPRLHAVAKSMDSAAALTSQILDFSRSQLKEREDRDETGAAIDLNALVVDLGPVLCRLVDPEISLDLSLCEKPALVLADPGHIRQIVTRFVIHARGFGTGAKKILLTTAIDDNGLVADAPTPMSSAPSVSLSVMGRTVPGEPRNAGAEEPRNGSNSIDIGEARASIGMGTSRAILAQYGGAMTAVVEPATGEYGPGIRYSMYLPLASRTRPAQTSVYAPPSGVAAVLLVEEEPLVRELSRDMLERQGFRVLTAGNVDEAERIARGHEIFDVLITAWAPDGGHGPALARTLREMRPELRVLFVAGYSDGAPVSLPAPGASAILQKPFSGDSLARSIRQLLDRSQPAGT